MDSTCKFANLNTPIINLIKHLIVTVLFTLAAPVFAEDCFIKLEEGDLDSSLIACTKAAEQGDVTAQHNLGQIYNLAAGTLKDYKQSVYWYTKAAEQGHAFAQYNLGGMYNRGKGTPKDDKQAVYW
jgi:hypothetical protein